MEDPARVARAFKAFQDAARTRDDDPETFEAARTRYYFLTKGQAWLDQEKKRIAAEKLDPVLAEYRDMYTSLHSEAAVQKGYTDSIEAIRNKQEEIKGSTDRQRSFLAKLMSDESQKKSAYNRYIELTNPSSVPTSEEPTEEVPFIVRYFSEFPASFSVIMDVILALLIIGILYVFTFKTRLSIGSFFQRLRTPQTSSILLQTPVFGPARTATINSR